MRELWGKFQAPCAKLDDAAADTAKRPLRLVRTNPTYFVTGKGFDFRRYADEVTEAFKLEVSDRDGRILKIIIVYPEFKHTHVESPNLPCLACTAAKRAADGKPIVSHHITVCRNVEPLTYTTTLMEPRSHNPRKGSPAYHFRIQKKWNKAAVGKTVTRPVTETVIFSLTTLQYKIIRDYYRRCGK